MQGWVNTVPDTPCLFRTLVPLGDHNRSMQNPEKRASPTRTCVSECVRTVNLGTDAGVSGRKGRTSQFLLRPQRKARTPRRFSTTADQIPNVERERRHDLDHRAGLQAVLQAEGSDGLAVLDWGGEVVQNIDALSLRRFIAKYGLRLRGCTFRQLVFCSASRRAGQGATKQNRTHLQD